MNSSILNPGSEEAMQAGCRCPYMDNGHGRGYLGDGEKLRDQNKKIMLCFTCDPYPVGYDSMATRKVIRAIKESGNHVQILTKGDETAQCFLRWKVSSTPAGRLLFQLAASAHPTKEIGPGLLPTPKTSDYKTFLINMNFLKSYSRWRPRWFHRILTTASTSMPPISFGTKHVNS